MQWIQRRSPLMVIAMFGVVVAIVLFAVTAGRAPDAPADFDFQNAIGRPGGLHLSPYAEEVVLSGFDLWTGEPHGWMVRQNPHGLGEMVDRGPVPADIVGRRAIPLPIGFALGALLGVAFVRFERR